MGVPKRLTEKQIKFANLIVTEEGKKTDSECAIEAGYKPDGAYVCASRLQNPALYPLVSQYIGRLRAEKLKKYDITYEKHLAAAGNMEIARGKAAGFQNNNHLHLHKDLNNVEESELDKMLAKALQDFKPIIDSDAEVIEETKE